MEPKHGKTLDALALLIGKPKSEADEPSPEADEATESEDEKQAEREGALDDLCSALGIDPPKDKAAAVEAFKGLCELCC